VHQLQRARDVAAHGWITTITLPSIKFGDAISLIEEDFGFDNTIVVKCRRVIRPHRWRHDVHPNALHLPVNSCQQVA